MILRKGLLLSFFSVFVISSIAFAKSNFQIKQIISSLNRVVISIPKGEELQVGDELIATSENKQQCSIKILKVNKAKKIAMGDTNKCPFANELKKNQRVEKSYFAMFNDDEKQNKPRRDKPRKEQVKREKKKIEDSSLPSKNESWYTYWGFGLSPSVKYSPIDVSDIGCASDRVKLNFDLFGFYWPIRDHKQIMGFIVNVVDDIFKVEDAEYAVIQVTWAFSSMYFFGRNVGEGFFARADAGFSRLSLSGPESSESTNVGYGFLFGAGYALPISRETRTLFNLNYGYRKAKYDAGDITFTGKTLSLSVGFLF